MRRRTALSLAATALAFNGGARALESALGPVILTLSGRISHTNQNGVAVFDMAMLERLPQNGFSTRTPWFSQARRFSGPLLRTVLAAVGSSGTVLRAVAINDYRVDIPADDAQRHDMLLATQVDDKPILVRDKGPLLIVYPFDAQPALRSAVYYSRCAWQLKSIEVL